MHVTDTAVIADGTHTHLNLSTYRNNKGKVMHWEWVERTNKANAVVIVAMVEDKIVVTREFRVPMNGYEWGFPAGLLEEGEPIEHAAGRELMEETGLTMTGFIKKSSPLVYNSPGITNEGCYMVYVTAEGKPTSANTEDSEEIKTFLMTREEARNLLEDDTRMKGAKALLVLDRFVEHGDV